MKKTTLVFVLMAFVAVSLSGCKGDDGPAGPSGPAGPAGPQGGDANFQVAIINIPSGDWGTGGYVEYPCSIITPSVMDSGLVVAYIQDDFGYYDGIPSAYHEITGFGYVYAPAPGPGGVMGFESDPAAPPTVDRQAKVVTMSASFLRQIEDRSVLQSYESFMRYVQTRK